MAEPTNQPTTELTNQLTGRVDAIVWWLIHNSERIEAMAQGRVVFDVSGASVKPSVQESYDAIRSGRRPPSP